MSSIELIGSWWGHADLDGSWKSYEKFLGEYTGVMTCFYNASDKTIKYITFTYVPYNQVDDVVIDTANKSVLSGKLVGPVDPGHIAEACFGNLWKSSVITRVEISKVFIEYMDGTNETIFGNDIVNVTNEPVKRYEQGFKRLIDPSDYITLNWYKENKFNKQSSYYQQHESAIIKAKEDKEKRKRANEEEYQKLQEERRKKKEEDDARVKKINEDYYRQKEAEERRIQVESSNKRKRSLIVIAAIILVIVASFIATTIKNNNEKYDISNVYIGATEFLTGTITGNTLDMTIEAYVNNGCDIDIKKIEGRLLIYDMNENLLYEGTFIYNESVMYGSTLDWTYEFTLEADSSILAEKIATSDSIMFEFVITDVYFADGVHKSAK
ncbi:MAG: hypothetical protein IKA84_00695 [Clostridia bacterium]|nr:hypothetical protein [Clostridia bacterium]